MYLDMCISKTHDTPAVVNTAATRTAEVLPELLSQNLFLSVSHICTTVTHSLQREQSRKTL